MSKQPDVTITYQWIKIPAGTIGRDEQMFLVSKPVAEYIKYLTSKHYTPLGLSEANAAHKAWLVNNANHDSEDVIPPIEI